MRKVYQTHLSAEECRAILKDNVSLISFNFWDESYTGWVRGKRYRVCYHKGEESRLFSGIKRIKGTISTRQGKTRVTVSMIHGLADPKQLLGIAAVTMLIFLVAYSRANFLQILIGSILWTMMCLVTSLIFAVMMPAIEREAELMHFITELLKLEEI